MISSSDALSRLLFFLRTTKAFQQLAGSNITVRKRWSRTGHNIYIDAVRNVGYAIKGFANANGGEAEEQTNFLSIVQMNRVAVFWDIGTNVGVYTSLFKAENPAGTAICFEPDPRNVALLRKTLSANSFANVDLVTKAVTDHVGVSSFFTDDVTGSTGGLNTREDGLFFVEKHYGVTPRQITTEVTTVDVEARSHPNPGFVKIDVEGAEVQVLQGAEQTICDCCPIIMLEGDTNAKRLAELLWSYGYNLHDMKTLKRVTLPSHNTLAIRADRHVLPEPHN